MFVLLSSLRAIPHNSKCRYGERGAADAKPKAQIILDAAKVSAASGGCSEPKQGQRSQSARGFCPRSTMRVPQPDIIEHFGNADAVPQLPERCLSRKAGIVRCCLGYLLTKQKARSPAVKRVPHAFVQKQNLFCSFYAFVSGIRTGSAAFALRTPLSLLRVWIVLIIAYCQNFASTFCRHQVDFCRRSPYSIKLFLRFSSCIPVFAFFFSVKLSFGLNNFKITAFPPHHWVMPGSGQPSPAALFRCFSPPYVVTALFVESFLCQFLMSSKIPHCFSLYRTMVLYRTFVLFYAGFFRHFPILYIL